MLGSSKKIELNVPSERLDKALKKICRTVAEAGGRAFVVGGSVRDSILGIPSKDIDIEVYRLEPAALERLLQRSYAIDIVGKSFGVLKVKGLPIDVAFPRRESKVGFGHRSFEILADPTMTTKEAQSRRDFTINAMYLDPLNGELIDHFDGQRDLENRVLRHTSARFSEDPLRVLRAMQFAARFDLEVAEETVELCRSIEPEGLPAERLYEEWKKLVLTGVRPSRGLAFLNNCGWIKYFPELEALLGLEQDPLWHPEGDVWNHTLECMDAFARDPQRGIDPWDDLVVGFAVLCHDFGKPQTTEYKEGRIISHRHEEKGEAPTRSFLARLTNQRDLVEQVVPLVVSHLAPVLLYTSGAGDAAIRRLARRVGRIDLLIRVARADQLGRGSAGPHDFPAGVWLQERAKFLEVESSAPQPLVQGRHLIELGERPGPHFREILDRCFEAQIAGDFSTLESGKRYAETLLQARRDES